jgi:hypothetical protein
MPFKPVGFERTSLKTLIRQDDHRARQILLLFLTLHNTTYYHDKIFKTLHGEFSQILTSFKLKYGGK